MNFGEFRWILMISVTPLMTPVTPLMTPVTPRYHYSGKHYQTVTHSGTRSMYTGYHKSPHRVPVPITRVPPCHHPVHCSSCLHGDTQPAPVHQASFGFNVWVINVVHFMTILWTPKNWWKSLFWWFSRVYFKSQSGLNCKNCDLFVKTGYYSSKQWFIRQNSDY